MADIGNDGERMTADAGNWSYYAHLSIYRFALEFLHDKKTLDAGCGAGYGTAYLREHGITDLTACDAGAEAVDFCKSRYASTGIDFHVQDLCATLPYEDQTFEAIFSSNVMEHLADIDHFMSECHRVIRPDGVMVIAVPPIVDPASYRVNVENVFHVTHLTPFGWYSKIGRYFEDIRCFVHKPAGRFADQAVHMEEVGRPASEVTIRETDFEFPERSSKQQNQAGSITAVYVASRPRQAVLSPTTAEHLPYTWFSGAVVAQVIQTERAAHHAERDALCHERDALKGRLAALSTEQDRKISDVTRRLAAVEGEMAGARGELDAIRQSTSWRATAPARKVIERWRR